MSTAIARRGKRELIFDVDGSQYAGGLPCSLCGVQQVVWDGGPRSFVRVREKLGDHSEHVALICPDCIARATIQAERHNLWRQLSGPVAAAIKRTLSRKSRLAVASDPSTTHGGGAG